MHKAITNSKTAQIKYNLYYTSKIITHYELRITHWSQRIEFSVVNIVVKALVPFVKFFYLAVGEIVTVIYSHAA